MTQQDPVLRPKNPGDHLLHDPSIPSGGIEQPAKYAKPGFDRRKPVDLLEVSFPDAISMGLFMPTPAVGTEATDDESYTGWGFRC